MNNLKIDVEKIREDFPLLKNGSRVCLDNAAMSQKPQCVIECVSKYYSKYCANVHRGVDSLSEEATFHYENTRRLVKDFIEARFSEEIIFTKGTTEGINLVAMTWGEQNISAGDVILISEMEHHANMIPWILLAQRKQAEIKIIPLDDEGNLRWDQYTLIINEKVKLVALTSVSNVLGTVNPVKKFAQLAHKYGACVLVDCAQAIMHVPVSVQKMGADFICFSGYKMLGPSGVGVLYGRRELLEKMPPFLSGGHMVKTARFDKVDFHGLPHKFEAGTAPIEGVIGLGQAIKYLESIGLQCIWEYEKELNDYVYSQIKNIPEVHVLGNAEHRAPIFSISMKNIHPHDLGTFLDEYGISVRVGHHCSQPIMRKYNVPATLRASFVFYNSKKEGDYLAECLCNAGEFFYGTTKEYL